MLRKGIESLGTKADSKVFEDQLTGETLITTGQEIGLVACFSDDVVHGIVAIFNDANDNLAILLSSNGDEMLFQPLD